MTFWHKLGFHDWHFVETIKIVQEKCGFYDPRDDAARSVTRDRFICCLCGITKLKPEPEIYYL